MLLKRRFGRRNRLPRELQLDEVISLVEMTVATAMSLLKYRVDCEE
jgi:hypothetical protein